MPKLQALDCQTPGAWLNSKPDRDEVPKMDMQKVMAKVAAREAEQAEQLAALPADVRTILEGLPMPCRIGVLSMLEELERSSRLGLSLDWNLGQLVGAFRYARLMGHITEAQFEVLASYKRENPSA